MKLKLRLKGGAVNFSVMNFITSLMVLETKVKAFAKLQQELGLNLI